jgi:predicted trehalose synthase
MVRSFDHLARWAVREAPEARPIAGRWIHGCRLRFLTAYDESLAASGSSLVLDRRLLRAFEVEKEVYELGYAAAFLPTWLFVAREAMRDLLA